MTAKEVNEAICEKYGIPMELNDGQSVLANVDIHLRPDDFPSLVVEYLITKDDIIQQKEGLSYDNKTK